MPTIEEKQLKINNRNYNANQRADTVAEDKPSYSQFDLSHSHLLSFDSGKAVPIFLEEVLPGDIWSIKVDGIIRMSTPASNTMMNPIISINFFYVSNMSIWEQWKYFMGETKTQGYQKNYVSVPVIENVKLSTELKVTENDLLNYIGALAVGTDINGLWNKEFKISRLPIIVYGKCWNDWYRDENLDDEVEIEIDDDNPNLDFSTYSASDDYHKNIKYGKGLAPTYKLPDMFVTCLPWVQKGANVPIANIPLESLFIRNTTHPNELNLFSPHWYNDAGSKITPSGLGTTVNGTQGWTTSPAGYGDGQTKNLSLEIAAKDNIPLYNINDLRMALSLQHLLELDARYGTRYNEYLYAHWGVNVDPLDINKSLQIGGYEDSLKISQVVQSSSSTATQPMGSLGGILQNIFNMPEDVKYAATQHGYIIGIITVRTPIVYSQGVRRLFTRLTKYEYYDPLLANISDQPIYNYELNDNIRDAKYADTFGFNEAWVQYRYSKNKATGYMSSTSEQSLANLYTYSEKYANTPSLNKEWMKYDPNIIKNTLFNYGSGKTNEFYHQFIANINFDVQVERKIPLYGIPGVQRV